MNSFFIVFTSLSMRTINKIDNKDCDVFPWNMNFAHQKILVFIKPGLNNIKVVDLNVDLNVVLPELKKRARKNLTKGKNGA